MRIVTLWVNIFLMRRGFSAAAAGLVVLLYCFPSWGYGSGLDQESIPILAPAAIDDCGAGYEFLSKKGKKWQDLSPEEKEKLRQKYKEWKSLSPKEKKKMRRRMDRLNNMSPREREVYKKLYRKWRHLPPDERQQLEKELDNWENLSPRQQEAIRRRFMK